MASKVKAAELGMRVREQRKLRGLSQDQLAMKVGYSDKTMVSKIEKGYVDLPLSRIGDLSYALGISPYYLLGMTDDPKFDHRTLMPNPQAEAVKPEHRLYSAYRSASEKTQQAVCLLLEVDPGELPEN